MVAFRYFIYFACVIGLVCGSRQYKGYSVYQVTVADVEQADRVYQLEKALLLNTWRYPSPARPGLVIVPKKVREEFQNELSATGIKHIVLTENVMDLLELKDEEAAAASYSTTGSAKVNLPLDRILTLSEVENYLRQIAEAYPNVATLQSAGKTFEGRDIWYLKISTTNFQDKSKPVVYIQSLIHAREWISLPASLYAIQELVVKASALQQEVDWIVMPVANPDGYLYSHESIHRFWNMNRRVHDMNTKCGVGVDLNHNFDFNWGTASSSNPCMYNFHGPAAFTEAETVAIRDLIQEHAGRLELFIDLQGVGSNILYSYGNGRRPANDLVLNLLAVRQARAINAVRRYTIDYSVGNYEDIKVMRASGMAIDYAKQIGVPLTYIYELPARSGAGNGLNGLLVDPSFIGQAGMETWEGMKAAAEYVRTNNRLRKF